MKLIIDIPDERYNYFIGIHSDTNVSKIILYELLGLIRTGQIIEKGE